MDAGVTREWAGAAVALVILSVMYAWTSYVLRKRPGTAAATLRVRVCRGIDRRWYWTALNPSATVVARCRHEGYRTRYGMQIALRSTLRAMKEYDFELVEAQQS